LLCSFEAQFISSGESAASAYETDAAVHAACQRRQRTFRVRTGRVELPNNYDKISDPVLIEISLGHDKPATDAENEVLTRCAPPFQTG
jgi:hypothetical protein